MMGAKMCDPGIGETGPAHSAVLTAPCGKRVCFAMPDDLNPRGDDEDIGAALGSLMRMLGYGRRGWTLDIETRISVIGVGRSGEEVRKRQVWSR